MNKEFYPVCSSCSFAKFVILKFVQVNGFKIYFCKYCQSGFTYPYPKNISEYYHSNYWVSPGHVGKVKILMFNIFHRRRKIWLNKYLKNGCILEIGAGEGLFAKSLGGNFEFWGIEFEGAKIKNKEILRVDYLKWQTTQKFDAVIFWESLEHVPEPQEYLRKSYRLLKDDGKILIEIPRFDSFESRFFKSNWFHLDPPRHLTHFTDAGLVKVLKRNGFEILERKNVLAYEYTIWGFVESILDIFRIKSTDYFKKNTIGFYLAFLMPLMMIAFLFETALFVVGQSPIVFVAAKKRKNEK